MSLLYKYFLSLCLIILFIQPVSAQIRKSNCNAPDSVKVKYQEDADRMALRRVFSDLSNYIDSSTIPGHWSDTIMDALMSVYNVDSIPARDTVFKMFNIHTFTQPVLNSFYLAADSNLGWMQQIHKNVFPTGVDSFDNLMKKYKLSMLRYYRLPSFHYHIVVFETKGNYNFEVISNHFDSLQGVLYANRYSVAGDGNDIKATMDSTFTDLVFSKGWGDCPTGCMQRRYWKFRAFKDCSVSYLGSYGHLLSTNSVRSTRYPHIHTSPNPFTTEINILDIAPGFEYKLINSIGQMAMKGSADSNKISGLDGLKAGVYILEVKSQNVVMYQKVVKE